MFIHICSVLTEDSFLLLYYKICVKNDNDKNNVTIISLEKQKSCKVLENVTINCFKSLLITLHCWYLGHTFSQPISA